MILKNIELKNTTLRILIAKDILEWKEGLKGSKLDHCDGLLIIFPDNRIANITMIGMREPIDIIWLDEKRQIQKITEKLEPLREDGTINKVAGVECKYVLEIQSGKVKNLSLLLGEKLAMFPKL